MEVLFYSQDRKGKNLTIFRIYKLRSMKVIVEEKERIGAEESILESKISENN